MITIKNISKRYGSVQALDAVSLEVQKGALFGLIGPDGAGKTTLIRILASLLLPDKGKASVNGLDVVADYRKIRDMMGYMPGKFSLYQDMTVQENLAFFATIFGTTIEENYALVKDIYAQIEPFKNRRAGQLSGGMKQKLALSCALIHSPKVLYLDEPTTGVDAVSRKEFWGMLKKLKSQGITMLVSTPYMDEASLCDRVALIQKGQILEVDTPEAIVDGFEKPLWAIKAPDTYRLIQDLRAYPYAHTVFPFGESLHYTDTRQEPNIHELQRYLSEKQHESASIHLIKPTIEDRFMELMNQQTEAHHD